MCPLTKEIQKIKSNTSKIFKQNLPRNIAVITSQRRGNKRKSLLTDRPKRVQNPEITIPKATYKAKEESKMHDSLVSSVKYQNETCYQSTTNELNRIILIISEFKNY